MLNDLVTGNNYHFELYLCKPYTEISATPVHDIIGCISECSEIDSYKQELKTVSELNITMTKKWNIDQDDWKSYELYENELFDNAREGYYILLQKYIDDDLHESVYFYIYDVSTSNDGLLRKQLSCYSKEWLLNKVSIKDFVDTDYFSTTRRIYTGDTFAPATPTLGGVMDYVIQEKLNNTWTVSYVSSDISSKYRTFDFRSSATEVLRDIERMFNCICFVNTYEHSFSFISYDELSTQSNVILSDSNIIKDIYKDIKVDDIVTRLYVEGKDGAVINAKNVTGKPYLDNFLYFRNSNYMSQSLRDALATYDILLASSTPTFDTKITELEGYQTELSTLQIELYYLQVELYQLEDNEDLMLKFGSTGQYNTAHALTLIKAAEVQVKEDEITAKQAQITTCQDEINVIIENVSYDNNFTTTQLKELQQYIHEDTVTCETDDEDELYQYGVQILNIRKNPPIEYKINMCDLFGSDINNYEWDKITLGGIVNIESDELEIQTSARITQLSYSPDNNDLGITISNKYYYDSDLDYIGAMIALTKQNATILETERSDYNEYQDDKDELLNEDDTLTNPIDMGDGTQITRRGQFLRDLLSSEGQMRILGDRILFTNNNWDDEDGISTAITSDGIFCEKFFVITNTDGSVEINDENIIITDLDLTLTTALNNTIYLNPDVGLKILQGSTPTIYADVDGSIYLKNVYLQNEDNSISISPSLIDVTNGKIRIKNTDGSNIIIDEYGIEPKFLDYHKNNVWNSSFEVFNTSTYACGYWTGGVASTYAQFHGTVALKLEASETTIQTDAAATNPDWTDYANIRVSFQCRCTSGSTGYVTCSVYDKTNDGYFTIWDSDFTSDTELEFTTPDNWVDSRFTFAFDPTEIVGLGDPCVAYKLKFENSGTADIYIDCVQASVDFSGKWSQLYKDGAHSVSATSMDDFEYFVNYYEQHIYVQPDEPTGASEDECWIDTDNYSRYDINAMTASDTELMADQELIMANVIGITITLQTPVQDGVVKIIKNTTIGDVYLSGDFEESRSSMTLFPKECVHLMSYNSIWYIT